MRNVALFGGSFDPPHTGHLAIVETALDQLDIERLIIVPAYLNPFKTHSCAPASVRLEWLRTIFSDWERVEVSDFEITRNRPTPSIETVRHFAKEAERLYFIIGADNVATLPQWHAYDELNAQVTWVVAKRGDIEIPDPMIVLDIDQPISSTALREHMTQHHLPPQIAKEIAAFYKEHHARTH